MLSLYLFVISQWHGVFLGLLSVLGFCHRLSNLGYSDIFRSRCSTTLQRTTGSGKKTKQNKHVLILLSARITICQPLVFNENSLLLLHFLKTLEQNTQCLCLSWLFDQKHQSVSSSTSNIASLFWKYLVGVTTIVLMSHTPRKSFRAIDSDSL